jgi:hypothetical protein
MKTKCDIIIRLIEISYVSLIMLALWWCADLDKVAGNIGPILIGGGLLTVCAVIWYRGWK